MADFPLNLVELMGHWESYIVYIFIGIAFGAVLEMSGFGISTKLAAQFYFTDMTVFKVMFTAIVVAMLLIFLATGLGLLDYNLIWVNPTYMMPGIVGGLLMGIGFILGGFCPGTSIVSAATLRLDGIMFVLGVFFGIFLFGETVSEFDSFWHSTYMGRFTIQEWLNVDTGVVVLGITVMALVAFAAAEVAEQTFGEKKTLPQWRYMAAGGGIVLSIAVLGIGQPTTQDKWEQISKDKELALSNRAVQIHPAELLKVTHDDALHPLLIDVRNQSDYNDFHLLDAENIPLKDISDQLDSFHEEPSNTVFILMSNDETAATEAWKIMMAESVPNVYILEGGINNWIYLFGDEALQTQYEQTAHAEDTSAYQYSIALGSRHPAANPNQDVFEGVPFEEKVKIETKRGASGGGCG